MVVKVGWRTSYEEWGRGTARLRIAYCPVHTAQTTAVRGGARNLGIRAPGVRTEFKMMISCVEH